MTTATLPEAPENHDHTCGQPLEDAKGTVRVLHVVTGEFYAGAERVQDLLAGQLGRWGFEVGFACLKPGQFAEMRQNRQAPIYELPMNGRLDLRPVWKLVRTIRREDYQLLHAHTVRSALVAGLASILTGVPLVCHVHSPTSNDSTRRWRDRINGIVERFNFRRASALITVSNSLANYVRNKGADRKKLSVVHNGVPSRKPATAKDTSKASWTLGTVALFRPRKGIEVLLEALAILRSKGVPLRLRAVGDFETPEYRREVQELCDKLELEEAVEWTGFAKDVNSELAQMDLFVLPSLFGEGLPMVVLEAMAAGLPVVATNVEGIPEAIRHGQDGLIARPGDPQDLAAAIGRIVTGEVDAKALRESALERQAGKFSETSMAAGVAEVYRRVLSDV